jgi:hypothetical protein
MNTPVPATATSLQAHKCSIYRILSEYQVTADWDQQELMKELHRWAEILIFEFKLEISHFALSIDYLSAYRLGHFRHGHNGFGLKAEIAINRRYLHREPWRVLGTLLHELLHAEQEENSKPGKHGYHNKAFRARAMEFGLIIDSRGHTQYAPTSRFKTLLAQHGIHIPDLPPPVVKLSGQSKQKLWMCPCGIRARVAVPRFHVRCPDCQGEFVLVR